MSPCAPALTAPLAAQLTKSMVGVVRGMDTVLASMDTNRVRVSARRASVPALDLRSRVAGRAQIADVLERFEKNFDDLDVKSGYMESAMASSTAVSTPQDQVESLIQQVADEHGLQVSREIASAPTGAVAVSGEAMPTGLAGRATQAPTCRERVDRRS